MRNVVKFDECCVDRAEIVGIQNDKAISGKTLILLRGGHTAWTSMSYRDAYMEVFATPEEMIAAGMEGPD